MRRIKVLAIVLVSIAGLTLGACGETDGDGNGSDTTTMTLSSESLPALGEGYQWEGWLIVDGSPVSTGKFSVEEGTSDYTFDVDSADADAATKFVLTIEPTEGDDPAPAATKFLAGDLSDGQTTATIDTAPALGTDFSSAAGSYVLAAPSADNGDYKNGIWFLDNSSDPAVASLTLPDLPEGWAYEGWVVDTSGESPMPVTTGRFTAVDGADSDMAGPAAGPNSAPAFPGQDFVASGSERDLTSNYMAVISVEPQPDDSPKPFALKPLVDQNIEDVGMGTAQDLSNAASDLPSAEVVIE